MEGLKKHYDRVILIVAALIAIGVSSLIAFKSFAFGDRFNETTTNPGEDFGPTDPAEVKSSTEDFGSSAAWKIPEMNGQAGKQLKLFRSVTIVEKDGQVYDLLDPNTPPLREGMSNNFLVEYSLDFKRDDVGELDPDGDGFTNREEAEGETSPRDPKEHPPYSKHLYVADIVLDPYTLEFKSMAGGTVTVRITTAVYKKSMFGSLNAPFADPKGDGGRFTPIKYTEKEITNEKGLRVDVSTLELTDAKNPGKNITLTHRVPFEMPIKHAVFGYRHEGFESWRKDVLEGDTFQLPNDPSTTFTLESVEDDGGARITRAGADGGNPKVIQVPAK